MVSFPELGRACSYTEQRSLVDGAWGANCPNLAWGKGGYGITWRNSDYRNSFAVLDESGAVVGTPHLVEGGLEKTPVAWTGSDYLMAWFEPSSPEQVDQYEMFTWRFQSDGALGSERVPSGIEEDGLRSVIGIVPTEDGAGVLWVQTQTLHLTRLTKVGTERWTSAVASDVADAGAAWNGDSFGIVWRESVGSKQLAFMEIDGSGELASGPVLIARDSPGSFLGPQLVWTGSSLGLLWQEYLSSESSVNHFVRLSRTGRVLGDVLTWSENSIGGNPSMIWADGEFAILSLTGGKEIASGTMDSYRLWLRVIDAEGDPVGSQLVSSDFRKHSTFDLRLHPVWADGAISFASVDGPEIADLVFNRLECE
jgi:hypothetical protein